MSSRRHRRSNLEGEGFIASWKTSLRRVRRDAPTFLDVFYVVALVAVLLVVDVFYIGHKHSNELKKMSALHNEEMMEMHARFQEQVKKVNQAHHEIRDQKSNDHAKANQKLKDLTSKEIDNLVNNIKDQLAQLKEIQHDAIDSHHDESHGDHDSQGAQEEHQEESKEAPEQN
ncbi:Oidioi.mRNA.OKI2018_I69.PAR.g13098.t1.cds [Oikopleura dioica]|uniref:Oidioi.mRNA.OKI2018_I69.PAR.g13098.t1.cds n=1 Tax=Oikopleura dioica TaxID=34765 RepID=A0ABN7SA04_OIKDI|nr:Oidioi.mRNA.OKI2018_I69.PAR.g13098.t1.cds [Oikopleura dioica]